MKSGEESTSAKTSKATTSAPEASTLQAYPDWSTSMQAYYGPTATPSPFFASTVTSPTPHPYLWGGQHPLIPPYGTPVPYPTMYPPGGVYGHPTMPTVSSAAHPNSDFDVKGSETKERSVNKKTKEALVSKVTENGKATSGSGNDGMSQSADLGSEGSSNASDENTKQEVASTKNGRFDQILADANGLTNSSSNMQAWKPGASMPATNLNIGMDLWNSSPAGATATSVKVRPNPSGVASAIIPSGVHDQWIQDERELKRQKRKQSNRESARRSRLRKQAECEELQTKVQNLSNENRDLRDELQRLSEECDNLKMENDSIKEELSRLHGPETVANLELGNPTSCAQGRSSEG